jgi:hypothetical protein
MSEGEAVASTEHIAPNTQGAIRTFVRGAVEAMSGTVAEELPYPSDQVKWEHASGGEFRPRKSSVRVLWRTLNDLRAIPEYDNTVNQIKSDACIGRQIDRMVGTEVSATRLEAGNILWMLIHAMVDERERLVLATNSLIASGRTLRRSLRATKFRSRRLPLSHGSRSRTYRFA